MTPPASAELFLCVDGGGTSVKVVICGASGEVLSRGTAGPCNVKSVGPDGAIAAILQATYQALALLDNRRWPTALAASQAPHPPLLDHKVFASVWLGLAGITNMADIEGFLPYLRKGFHVAEDDAASLRLTNDGHLLASRCTVLPDIDSTVAIVAGTGSVGLAFRKRGTELDQVGVSGGWGYLLGDEGSAYAIGRLAIRYILQHDDAFQSLALCSSPAAAQPRDALTTALLAYFNVPSASALVSKTYSDHSSLTPDLAPASFTAAETNRKVWIAEATRVVFSFTFPSAAVPTCEASRRAALEIVRAGVEPLVGHVLNLLGDRTVVVPERALLSLGGGLWQASEYVELLRGMLEEKGVVFGEVGVVADAAEEGAKALAAQARARSAKG